MKPSSPDVSLRSPIFSLSWTSVTLGMAFILNMLPWWQSPWKPDILALILVYWVVHRPGEIGMGLAFSLGLLMDVQNGSILGQHAVAYVLLCFVAFISHRRLLWFSPWKQAIQIFPLFLVTEALVLGVRALLGGTLVTWSVMLAPALQAALWPAVGVLLHSLQARKN